MNKGVKIGLIVTFLIVASILILAAIGSTITLRRFSIKSFAGFSYLEKNKKFPKEVIENYHCIMPILSSTKLEHANFLSVFLVSAYKELCRDEAPLRKSFLDNLYEDTDTIAKWLGYSAAQLKEASANAAEIVGKKKTKMGSLSKQELADLTITFFYALFKKMGKEYSEEVKSKEERDKMSIFSSFEREISLESAEDKIRSLWTVFHSLIFGFAVKTGYSYTCKTVPLGVFTEKEKHKYYATNVQNVFYSGFHLKDKHRDYKIYILQDFIRDEIYGTSP